MKLNLGSVKNTTTGQPVQSTGLGLNLNSIQRNEDIEMNEEDNNRRAPAMQPNKKIPSLKLGDVS